MDKYFRKKCVERNISGKIDLYDVFDLFKKLKKVISFNTLIMLLLINKNLHNRLRGLIAKYNCFYDKYLYSALHLQIML
jgi:hypothetical protein